MCWLCGGGAVQTREHLFRHCSRWNYSQIFSRWVEVKATHPTGSWKIAMYTGRNVSVNRLSRMRKATAKISAREMLEGENISAEKRTASTIRK